MDAGGSGTGCHLPCSRLMSNLEHGAQGPSALEHPHLSGEHLPSAHGEKRVGGGAVELLSLLSPGAGCMLLSRRRF